MRRATLLAVLLVAVCGCEAERAQSAPAPSAPPEGQVLYAHGCAPCHGRQGRGDGPMGARLGASDLTDPSVQPRLTDAYVRARVREGGPRMPPIPGMTERQIADVAAHLRSLSGG